jgi:signal transduction histidine kinase/CheY-like chemotaxis protein
MVASSVTPGSDAGRAGAVASFRAYYANSSTITGLILAACNGALLGHFFGAPVAIAWTAAAMALLLVVVRYAVDVINGVARAAAPAVFFQAMLVIVWAASATALWLTGERAAWVISIITMSSWAIHVIFSVHRARRSSAIIVLALTTLPLLGFLVHAAWTSYPVSVAIAATVSAAMMIVSIGASARVAADNFSKLQRALSEAAATRNRLEFAIEAAGDGYFEVDFDTLAVVPNEPLSALLGLAPGPQTVASVGGSLHPDDVGAAKASFAALKSGASAQWRQEMQVRVASGEYRWLFVRARVLDADAAHGRMLIGTVVDMSKWKALEGDLRAAKEAAEASSRAKSEFLANMSHEIRTPLNGVLGMAQALGAEDLAPAQREKVAVILDSGKSLTALLNDVLDLSKIEAGKLEIAPVPGDFLHTMKRTRQLFQSTAEDKGLELSVRYDSNFPQRMSYDPVRVRQCVGNLISNAIKFTAQGRIEVSVKARAHGHGGHLVTVEVSDTGIGMSADVQARLFSAFTQADGATTRRFGGTGLGLAISRQLARLMGGDLIVASEEKRGSTFTLTFRAGEAAPLADAPRARETPVAPAKPMGSLRGVRVLLTDDNAINRQVIKLFLAPQGVEIVEATNGKEALDAVSSQPFDIVLLDVHMPVMDGKEAIQRMRAANKPWSVIPVIALTADAMTGDREKYLGLGMTDYIAKPVDQRELVAKMLQALKLDVPPLDRTGS